MPAQIHDVKNILVILLILADSNSYNHLKAELDTAVEVLGLDAKIDNIEWRGYNNGILAIVKEKQKNNISIILTDIKYEETNSKMRFLGIGYMLGVLLDNAIETGTKKPILIKIHIDRDILIISVPHEYERKYNDGFQKMFQKKYTTKEKLGQKHKLPNHNMFVNKHNGDINISYELNRKQNCNYLILTIDMGKWKIGDPKWNEETLSFS